jgi:hypothetical protein
MTTQATGATADTGTGATTGSTTAADWRSSLPDDLKAEPTLQKYADVPNLARAYVHAQRLIGAEKIPVPGKNAKPEDWDFVYSRLGRPESAEGYKFEGVENGAAIPEETSKAFAAQAHKLGLSARQAGELHKWYSEVSGKAGGLAEEDRARARDDAEAALKAEWGRAFDRKLQAANGAVSELFDENDIAQMKETGLANNPAFIRMMAKVAEQLHEDTVDGKKVTDALSPAEAEAKIAELMKHPAYMNKNDVQHAPILKEVMRLREIQFPS